MSDKDLELRTEEVNEIMLTPPSWMVSWGSSAVFLAILTVAFLAWYIKYPDIIYERLMLTSPNPPVSVIMEKGAVVERFLVEKGTLVKEKDILFVLESNAEYTHILQLDSAVEQWSISNKVKLQNLPQQLVLGTLEYPLNQLEKEVRDYKYAKNSQFPKVNIQELNKLIKDEERLVRTENAKRPNVERRLEMAERILKRKLTLFEQGAIARQEYKKYERDLSVEQEKLKNIIININTHRRNISSYEQQIVTVKKGSADGKNAKNIAVIEALNRLKSAIKTWKSDYLVRAAFEGKIAIYEDWQPHQFIEENTEVLTIEPKSEGVIGHLYLNANDAGKVKSKQEVMVKLDGYPFMEYGVLYGQINEVATVPKNGAYLVTVTFSKGMQTHLGKPVTFTQRMEGGAEIVTEKKRISDRILDKAVLAYNRFKE